MLHHLKPLEKREGFFQEAGRVLGPGGLLILNHNYDRHVASSWHLAKNARVKKIVEQINGTREEVLGFAEKAGLQLVKERVIKENVMKNYKAPMDTKLGRPSTLAVFTSEELEAFEERVRQLVEEGALEEWIEAETGKNVEELGYSTLFVFRKPAEN